MNIAVFTNNYLPNPYGVTGSIESFRREFEKRGNRVFIFAPHYADYQDKNPQVFRYPSLDIQYKIRFPLPIPYSSKMDKILENLDLDIIHSQHPNLLGTVAAKWARRKKIPLVFTWHTLYDHYTHFVPLIPDKIAAGWMIKKAVNYANKSDQIIVPTPSVEKIIRGWGVDNTNIEAVLTGIEEEIYKNADGGKIRKKYSVKDDEVLLLLVSRLTEEKNLEFLFRCVVLALKKNSRTKFLVAGEGNFKEKLEEIVEKNNLKDRIIFAGLVSREELKNYYAAGDIFVYSSLSETQGMVITEAMYIGLPIVAVSAPGAVDLIENKKNGFLVQENPEEFSLAIERLIKDENLRIRMSKEAAKVAREKYTASVYAEKMLSLYENVKLRKLRM